MKVDFVFFLNSILLGVGLAMDSFSVSVADTLNEPDMKKGKTFGIAGTFGIYQALMPMIGWVCVHTLLEYFSAFEKFIPWIALILLLYIGGEMLVEGLRKDETDDQAHYELTFAKLMVQGIATAIDALSVGFTIAEYDFPVALLSVLIVGTITFCISLCGCLLGKKFGHLLNNKASVLGGTILIAIGLEIWIKGVFLK